MDRVGFYHEAYQIVHLLSFRWGPYLPGKWIHLSWRWRLGRRKFLPGCCLLTVLNSVLLLCHHRPLL